MHTPDIAGIAEILLHWGFFFVFLDSCKSEVIFAKHFEPYRISLGENYCTWGTISTKPSVALEDAVIG